MRETISQLPHRLFFAGCCLFFILGGIVLSAGRVYAQPQNAGPVNLQGEVRLDWQGDYVDGNYIKSNSGFKGKYINVILFGNISDSFSYSYRQRLNKAHSDQSFFDATDWVYLTYHAGKNFSFSAGKQVVGIGGYEYDRAPIDLYFCSEFWNNIPCYQLGVSASYTTNSGKDKFTFQVCESPFHMPDEVMYGYNFMWNGSHGWFNTIYSANMFEYMPDEYIYYLALGNEFSIGHNTKLRLDLMNRATDNQPFFFRNCSVMGELAYNVKEKLNIFGKAVYDVNNTDTPGDYCVLPGTELTRVGAGIEFYPLPKGNRSVRLHATYCYTFGSNGNPAGTSLPEQSLFSIGLKWKIDIVSIAKRIVKKDNNQQ
ncbi:MAG: porin [Bacteroidales bacterium]|nr:porin [Bacteroidales bacterium]